MVKLLRTTGLFCLQIRLQIRPFYGVSR
jgi:hypothetical protein